MRQTEQPNQYMKDFNKHSLLHDLKRSMPSVLKNSEMIERAFSLAFDAHIDQFREGRDLSAALLPYIVHPVGVAKLCVEFWRNDELDDSLETIVSAALMHDVLEDTSVPYEKVEAAATARCAELVLSLTKPGVNKSRDRSRRNELFRDQIRAAGHTAVYVKLCDCIQNLSRPGSTPVSLLGKTIEKAKGPYSDLLVGTPFEERFHLILKKYLVSAEAVYNSHRGEDDSLQPEHLHVYLERLMRKTKGKELENHDVIEIVSRIPGVVKCVIGNLHECISNCRSLRSEATSQAELKRLSSELEDKGSTEFERVNAEGSDIGEGGSLRLIGSQLFSHGFCWLTIAVDPKLAPHWLCYSALRAVVGILSEGMEKQDSGEVLALAGRVWDELALSPEAFLKEDLGRHDIARLKGALDTAEYMSFIVRPALDLFCKGFGAYLQIDRVEGRVKRLGSVLRKLRNRAIDLNQIDDLVGFRVIFLSSTARNQFAVQIRDALLNRQQSAFYTLPINDETIIVDHVSSNLGYSAKHLRFTLFTPSKAISGIGCEIQMRTLHEDAWARVSEALVYKERALSKRKAQDLLDHLGGLRNDADRSIDDAKNAG